MKRYTERTYRGDAWCREILPTALRLRESGLPQAALVTDLISAGHRLQSQLAAQHTQTAFAWEREGSSVVQHPHFTGPPALHGTDAPCAGWLGHGATCATAPGWVLCHGVVRAQQSATSPHTGPLSAKWHSAQNRNPLYVPSSHPPSRAFCYFYQE